MCQLYSCVFYAIRPKETIRGTIVCRTFQFSRDILRSPDRRMSRLIAGTRGSIPTEPSYLSGIIPCEDRALRDKGKICRWLTGDARSPLRQCMAALETGGLAPPSVPTRALRRSVLHNTSGLNPDYPLYHTTLYLPKTGKSVLRLF